VLREAQRKDVAAILDLIKELAAYEREPNAVINTKEKLEASLFDEKHCHALVWEHESDGVIGFALYFFGYSTWKGKTVYLEDLYVRPQFRKLKIGEQLFLAVVDVAKSKGVKRMDWQVLEWNELAIKFYQKHKAHLDPEWINGRFFFE
jgi:GNAT superfamily N-acetyltransferase